MNNTKARIINVYTFSSKESGEMYARMTYTIKMQPSNNFFGSSVLECFVPIDSVGSIRDLVDKEVDLVIENVPGANHQLVARLVQIGNVKLSKK